MGDKVYFTAVSAHGDYIGPKPGNTTLKFDRNITNIGGGYDNTSGEFTAPFPGVYYFTFSYHAGKEKKSGLSLMKNGNVVVKAIDDNERAGTFSDNGGNSAVLQLSKDDKVWVQLPAGRQVWGSDTTTSFSGFLVSK